MDALRSRKILVIDDEVDFALLLKANLEETVNYEVVVANSGREGLQKARSEKPDLILLDVMMPGMGGLDVLKKLKGDTHTLSIPVIMLTAITDQQTKQQAGSLFDEDYLEKPIQVQVLKERIEKVLARMGC